MTVEGNRTVTVEGTTNIDNTTSTVVIHRGSRIDLNP